MNQQPVRDIDVAEVLRDLGRLHHGAADQRDLASVLERQLHRQLDAMDGRREAGDEQLLPGAGEDFLEARAHRAFARRVAAALDVGRILEQRQHAFLAVLGEGVQIEEPVVGGRRIDLEVAGMNQDAQRRMDRQRHAVHQAVRHLDGIDGERADLEALARPDLVEHGVVEQAVLFQLALDIGQGELGAIHRHVQFGQNPGQRADVVFVAVGQHDAAHVLRDSRSGSVMSGTTMSTPSSSASGNMSPASMTMMSSPQRMAMQFMPNSPSPPRGTTCSFPVGISNFDASTGRTHARWLLALGSWLQTGQSSRQTERMTLCKSTGTPILKPMPDAGPKSLMRRARRSRASQAPSPTPITPSRLILRSTWSTCAWPTTCRPSPTTGYFGVEMHLLDHIAEDTIRASMKMAAAEGAGLGMGGMFTVLPDLGILAAITMRMIQKLSLMYGFPYNTEEEEAELWVAAASAAGVDIRRELVEKQFVSKFVPEVIQRIAARASAEIVGEMGGRTDPAVSGVIGAG